MGYLVVTVWTAHMIVYEFPYKLIVAPVFIIILAVALILLIKKPSLARAIGVFLFVFGAIVTIYSPRILLIEGFFFGLVVWLFSLILLARPRFFERHFDS